MGPGCQLVGGLDEKGIFRAQVIDHRRGTRRHRRLAAGHEFHQRQTLTFAVGGVDHVPRGLHQLLVVRIGEVTVDQNDAATVRLVFVQMMEDIAERFFGVVVSELEHQRRVFDIAKTNAKSAEHVFPVLAPVTGIEHRGINHAVKHQRLLGGRRGEVDAVAAAQVRRPECIQIEGAAVRDQTFDRQAVGGGQGLLGHFRATGSKAVPDRRRHRDDRVLGTHRLVHGIDRVAGVGDRCATGMQDATPVIARLARKGFIGDRAELPRKQRQRRTGQVNGSAMRRRERQKHAGLATAQTLQIQSIDFRLRIGHFHDPTDAFEHRAILLEHEVIAVLRTPEVLRNGVPVGFRMNDDQHEALSVTGAASVGPAVSAKNSASRLRTGAKAQYCCMRATAAADIR